MKYKITRRINGVNYSVKIKKDGEILVSVPVNATDEKIRNFIRSEQKWINDNYARILDVTLLETLYDDSSIYILGYPYVIRTIYSDRNEIEYGNGYLTFYVSDDSIKNKETLYNKFIKDLLIKEVDESIQRYETITKLKVNSVSYKKMASAYGKCYCNSGIIMFDPRIIHKTKEFIDAVVLHEICHIKYFDHSKKFYDYILSIMPEYYKNIKYYKVL